MKKVIIAEPVQQVVTLSKIDVNKFYGVLVVKNKGFITRIRSGNRKFIALCRNNLTDGNYWDSFGNDCIQDLIKDFIDNDVTVFEFDTYAELFKWLGE